MNTDGFLGELGLILLAIILVIIIVPAGIGCGFALLTGAKGFGFYGTMAVVTCVIWLLLCCIWYWN